MKAYVELAQALVLQCLCVSILLYPVGQLVPLPDQLVAMAVGFLIGSGSWLQFERQRRVGDRREPE